MQILHLDTTGKCVKLFILFYIDGTVYATVAAHLRTGTGLPLNVMPR